jgi:signal transduction histidine kinase
VNLPDPAAGAFDAGQARVLVVEDDPHDREYLVHILRQDFQIAVAVDGNAALALLESEIFDVVLADNGLPGISGEELLTECQQRRPIITRVLLSGVLKLDTVLRSVNDGHIFAALKKPVDPSTLLTTMHNAARSCRMARERSLLISELANANAQIYEEQQNLVALNNELRMLVTIATHDLREPLRSTRFFLDKCVEALADHPDGEVVGNLRKIKRAHGRMDHLLVGLREWLHMQTGNFEVEEVDAGRLVEEALDNLSQLMAEREVDLKVPDSWPSICVNPPLIRSVFENLLTNAVRFSPNERPKISISWDDNGLLARFKCSDNGIGIDPAYHGQVFGMFKRLESKRKFEGTGAGLAICQKIVQRHNGEIGVESERGNGATFWFTLPLSQEDDSA